MCVSVTDRNSALFFGTYLGTYWSASFVKAKSTVYIMSAEHFNKRESPRAATWPEVK